MPHKRARIALHVVTLAVVAALLPSRVLASGPWSVGKGEWFSNLEGGVFSASSLYDSTGARFETGLRVEQRDLRSYSELGWKKHISVLIGIPAISVTRSDRFRSIEGTATGLQDLLLGLRYNLANGGSAFTVQADWSGPLGYNRTLDSLGYHLGSGVTYRDTIVFALGAGRTASRLLEHSGDGLQQLSAGLQVGTTFLKRGFLDASIAYAYRYYAFGKRKEKIGDLFTFGPDTANIPRAGKPDTTIDILQIERYRPSEGLWANQVVTTADLGFWVAKSVLLGGRYRGVSTVSNGPLVPEVNQQLAGPVLVYRVDDALDMIAGSWSTASGKNALHFDQVYVGVAFRNTKLNRLQGFTGNKHSP